MSTKSGTSEKAVLPKRPWYRLHVSTWMVIVIVAGFLAIIVIPGEFNGLTGRVSSSGFEEGENFLHGWPWVYLDRFEIVNTASYNPDINEANPPWRIPRAWKCYSSAESSKFTLSCLIFDLLVGATGILTIAFLFEWRRRYRNRLFQFTLRELLMLMLVTALVFSWWRVHHNQRIREQEIVKSCPDGLTWVDGYRGPQLLEKFFGTGMLDDFYVFTGFEYTIADQSKNDEIYSLLGDVHEMESIIGHWSITDRNLSQLSALKKLQQLQAGGSAITDSGMETIAHFPKLTGLYLWNTQITSRGIRYLESTPLLERLDLTNAPIDDDAIETLGSLKRLTCLDISGTKITEKGCEKLKAKLPDCEIIYKK